MTIRSLGFKWKNIEAIDLHSYSNLVKLGDMHQLEFADNFDFIISGWTLRYSNNVNKALSEILRIIKPGGLIFLLVFTYVKDREKNFEAKTNKTQKTKYFLLVNLKSF